MSVEDIRSRIAVINAEVARLNTERNQKIGKRDTLLSQLETNFAIYEKDYGVKLTTANLQAEIDSVTASKEKELSNLENIVGLINSGKVDEANKLVGVTPQDTSILNESEPTTQGVQQSVEKQNLSVEKATSSSVQPVQEVMQPIGDIKPPVQTSIPLAPPDIDDVAPPTPPTPPAPSKTSVLSGAESLDMGMSALEGFTKPNLGSLTGLDVDKSSEDTKPTSPVIQDFNSILNGTAFQPKSR